VRTDPFVRFSRRSQRLLDKIVLPTKFAIWVLRQSLKTTLAQDIKTTLVQDLKTTLGRVLKQQLNL
jgi:hypothetical protein